MANLLEANIVNNCMYTWRSSKKVGMYYLTII